MESPKWSILRILWILLDHLSRGVKASPRGYILLTYLSQFLPGRVENRDWLRPLSLGVLVAPWWSEAVRTNASLYF